MNGKKFRQFIQNGGVYIRILIKQGVKIFSPSQQDTILVLQKFLSISCFQGSDAAICCSVYGFDSILKITHFIFIGKRLDFMCLFNPPFILHGVCFPLHFPQNFLQNTIWSWWMKLPGVLCAYPKARYGWRLSYCQTSLGGSCSYSQWIGLLSRRAQS